VERDWAKAIPFHIQIGPSLVRNPFTELDGRDRCHSHNLMEAYHDVVDRVEQTREDGRAIQV